jgi:hypothetical protein
MIPILINTYRSSSTYRRLSFRSTLTASYYYSRGEIRRPYRARSSLYNLPGILKPSSIYIYTSLSNREFRKAVIASRYLTLRSYTAIRAKIIYIVLTVSVTIYFSSLVIVSRSLYT